MHTVAAVIEAEIVTLRNHPAPVIRVIFYDDKHAPRGRVIRIAGISRAVIVEDFEHGGYGTMGPHSPTGHAAGGGTRGLADTTPVV